MFKHVKRIIIIIIVLLVAVFVFLNLKPKSNSELIFNPKTEIIINPKRETIKEEITVAGSIDASLKSNLSFQTSGQLAWVGVKVGDQVKKGQAIASLNKEILKKQLQIDFNNYKTTATNFYDTTNKYKDSVLTEDLRRILERNQNTLDNSVINYELADLSIKYSTLTSPISGIVVNLNRPNSGVNIIATENIASIIDPQSIYFSSKIDQDDVPKIKVGDKAVVKLDSFPDKDFESQINYISFIPVSGESSTVYEIRFDLPQDENEDLKYRLGMDGDATIFLKQDDNALTIPIEAVHQEEDQPYVFIKEGDNSNLIKKYIKTGIETDTTIEILEGISENDQVIIKK